jgi:hypothetical protein
LLPRERAQQMGRLQLSGRTSHDVLARNLKNQFELQKEIN